MFKILVKMETEGKGQYIRKVKTVPRIYSYKLDF